MSSSEDSTTANQSSSNNSDKEAQELRIGIPVDEAYHLQKIKIIQELQSEIVVWAKRRLWFVALVTVLMGFFGVNALINQTINSKIEPLISHANEQITRAQIAAENATNSASSSEELVKSASQKVKKYESQVSSLQNTAVSLSEQFDNIRRDLDAEASNIRTGSELGLSNLKIRLGKLEDLVTTVAKESSITKAALEDYQKNIATIINQTENKKIKFEKNSKFTVRLYYEMKYDQLAYELGRKIELAGFKYQPWELKGIDIKQFEEPTIIFGSLSFERKSTITKILSEVMPNVNFTYAERSYSGAIVADYVIMIVLHNLSQKS